MYLTSIQQAGHFFTSPIAIGCAIISHDTPHQATQHNISTLRTISHMRRSAAALRKRSMGIFRRCWRHEMLSQWPSAAPFLLRDAQVYLSQARLDAEARITNKRAISSAVLLSPSSRIISPPELASCQSLLRHIEAYNASIISPPPPAPLHIACISPTSFLSPHRSPTYFSTLR